MKNEAYDRMVRAIRAALPEPAGPSLLLKIADAPGIVGGKALVLCAGNGKPLPCQVAVSTHTSVGALGRVTVEFDIDGVQVAWA